MLSSLNIFASNSKDTSKNGENAKMDQNDRGDRVIIVPEDPSCKDHLVSRLLEWNTDLESRLKETKKELSSLSHQLIALTGKQIFLQDKKNVIEEKLNSTENRCLVLSKEIRNLEKENRLLNLRLEFVMKTKGFSQCESPFITHLTYN
jgi:hypothetical protein